MQRLAIIYCSTLAVLLPLDLLFLRFVGKRMFQSQIGEMMLPTPRITAVVGFYFIYIAGIVTFVNRAMPGEWLTNALYGALFGLFCYATFELTSMALFKRWSWSLVVPDVAWGSFVTAVAAAVGGANFILRLIQTGSKT